MSTIRKDSLGLYVSAGGWKCRPFHNSKFKEGDNPKVYHFGGSTQVGVGKDGTCKNGEYLEYWCTCGTFYNEDEPSREEIRSYMWYKKHEEFHFKLINKEI